MSAKKSAKQSTKESKKASTPLTEEERLAVREAVKEFQEEKAGGGKIDGEKPVLAKIAAMKGSDRIMAERLHKIIRSSAPALSPRTWYGMPAYANKDGKVVCFFQDAQKFKTRYATFGFSDKANLDEGNMWPVAYALNKLTPAEETRIAELVKKAVK